MIDSPPKWLIYLAITIFTLLSFLFVAYSVTKQLIDVKRRAIKDIHILKKVEEEKQDSLLYIIDSTKLINEAKVELLTKRFDEIEIRSKKEKIKLYNEYNKAIISINSIADDSISTLYEIYRSRYDSILK